MDLHLHVLILESGVRAIPNQVTEKINNSTDGGTNSAILRYFGAFFGDPTTQDTSGNQPLDRKSVV